jgi:hypothetical protein
MCNASCIKQEVMIWGAGGSEVGGNLQGLFFFEDRGDFVSSISVEWRSLASQTVKVTKSVFVKNTLIRK